MNQWADGHLDLAYLAVAGRDRRTACDDPAQGCISLPDLRAGNVSLIYATIFTEPGKPDEPFGYRDSDDVDGAERAGLRQIEVYEALERAGEIQIVRMRDDLGEMTPSPARRGRAGVGVRYGEDHSPIKVVILMEGADSIRSPNHARMWFERGVRIVGLTWATGTRYAGGNAKPGPLTRGGREMIAALDELGIIHDLSHLSDPAVEELFALSRGKVIASHSNARALLAHEPKDAVPGVSAGLKRHLPDDFIREIAAREGVIGLNLYSKFLIGGEAVSAGKRATIDDCIAHIEHIANVMGHRRGIALGSDADGGFPPTMLPENLDHPRKWSALADALRGRGWKDQEISNFEHDNWQRFLSDTLPRWPP